MLQTSDTRNLTTKLSRNKQSLFFFGRFITSHLAMTQCNNQMGYFHFASVICHDTVASYQHPASGIKLALGFQIGFHRIFHMLFSANVITGFFIVVSY